VIRLSVKKESTWQGGAISKYQNTPSAARMAPLGVSKNDAPLNEVARPLHLGSLHQFSIMIITVLVNFSLNNAGFIQFSLNNR